MGLRSSGGRCAVGGRSVGARSAGGAASRVAGVAAGVAAARPRAAPALRPCCPRAAACRARSRTAPGVRRPVPGVLPLCGRAPARALSPGAGASASMKGAWVGPLRTGPSGLGDTAAFNPRGRRTVREACGASRTVARAGPAPHRPSYRPAHARRTPYRTLVALRSTRPAARPRPARPPGNRSPAGPGRGPGPRSDARPSAVGCPVDARRKHVGCALDTRRSPPSSNSPRSGAKCPVSAAASRAAAEGDPDGHRPVRKLSVPTEGCPPLHENGRISTVPLMLFVRL